MPLIPSPYFSLERPLCRIDRGPPKVSENHFSTIARDRVGYWISEVQQLNFPNRGPEKRFWEVDLLRGFAVVMMIVFHALFDLDNFGHYDIYVGSGVWHILAIITASLFIVLVGISLTLSNSRARMAGGYNLFSRYLKRGAKIFSWGLIITIITRLAMGQEFIVFGVLHLIGISIVLAYPLLRFHLLNLLLGAIVISIGLYIDRFTANSPWLLPLGIVPPNFYTLDYFPLFPWFGLVLVGLFLGNALYPNYARRYDIDDHSGFPLVRGLCFLGRNSLAIYLVHQPLLIASMYVLGLSTIF